MKRQILIILITTLLLILEIFVFGSSEIFNFVHKDYDFVMRISKTNVWYEEIKKVPFFSFVLDRKGLGFEDSFLRILEDMKYRTGISPDVVKDAFSNDIVLASKGVEINVMDLMSFDLNYYFEFIKTIATHTFIVFETKYTSQFPKALSFLLSVSYKNMGNNTFLLGDSLYCGIVNKYLIVAGSKQALELATKTFTTTEMQIVKTVREFDRLKAGTFWISGYAKPNTLKLQLPGGVNIDDTESEYLFFHSTISAGALNLTIEQKNKKQETTKKLSDNIANLQIAWNYYLSMPTTNTDSVVNSIKEWFQGFTPDINRFADFISYASKSSSYLYTIGRLESGDILFIFDNFSGKELESNIAKLGAKYDQQKQEWNMVSGNTQLYIYKS
ncbi:MAG TPA: hypothetical protein DE117_02645, partial [Fervidobacterium sp.]|nr:hypothetical protein [Fervidobacterium sp.]